MQHKQKQYICQISKETRMTRKKSSQKLTKQAYMLNLMKIPSSHNKKNSRNRKYGHKRPGMAEKPMNYKKE